MFLCLVYALCVGLVCVWWVIRLFVGVCFDDSGCLSGCVDCLGVWSVLLAGWFVAMFAAVCVVILWCVLFVDSSLRFRCYSLYLCLLLMLFVLFTSSLVVYVCLLMYLLWVFVACFSLVLLMVYYLMLCLAACIMIAMSLFVLCLFIAILLAFVWIGVVAFCATSFMWFVLLDFGFTLSAVWFVIHGSFVTFDFVLGLFSCCCLLF